MKLDRPRRVRDVDTGASTTHLGSRMRFLPLLESKRDGRALTNVQLRELIVAYAKGLIPDYQMAAFLMAVFFRGLTPAETRALTLAMRDTGEVLSFPPDPRPLVDKHSTGGVGDKVSLPLAPLLACLGFRVPMISGRGLGITGGTLDKLDSIPGFKTSLPAERIIEVVQQIGCVICGQNDNMVPADKGLYALRDVTATVPSMPLIVASILSKKLAEGLNALVLDVKFGAAAFMPTVAEARGLARAMVVLAKECGVNCRALLTNMDVPIGGSAGNWLEVKEAVACLENREVGGLDLRELVVSCAAHLLVLTEKARTLESAQRAAQACLASGEPRKKWDALLVAQGADLGAFNRKLKQDHPGVVMLELKANESGYLSQCDARLLGEVIRDLGGGRLTKESAINYEVGLDGIRKPGEHVNVGDTLARIHASLPEHAKAARNRLRAAFRISASKPHLKPLIREVVRV